MGQKIVYDPRVVAAFFREHNIPEPTFELQFHPERKWRFDISWPDHRLALEVEGGAWTGGRHTRGAGFVKDIEKYSTAAVEGWLILRTVPSELCMQDTIDMIRKALTNIENRRRKLAQDALTSCPCRSSVKG